MRALGLGAVVILGIAIPALLDEQSGVRIWIELRESLAHSSARVALLEAQNDSLRSEIELLETEPQSLDRVIREELDLALPGETIVYFRRNEASRSIRADHGIFDEASNGLGLLSAGEGLVFK